MQDSLRTVRIKLLAEILSLCKKQRNNAFELLSVITYQTVIFFVL